MPVDVGCSSASSSSYRPSAALKLQAFACALGVFALILGVTVGAILLDVGGSRIPVLTLYVTFRILTSSRRTSTTRPPFDGAWRRFSEDLFFPATVMRRYLDLGFDDEGIPEELVVAESEPDARFVLAFFPHGCASDFRILMDGILGQVFPNLIAKDSVRTLAASILFKIPIVREITTWTGCVDASRTVAESALDDGKTLVVLPGGEIEQLMTIHGRERVYLSNRKGFVKLAMRKGVPVVPVYVFGSSDAYRTFYDDDDEGEGRRRSSSFDWTFYELRRKIVKNFGICIIPYTGLWGFPVLPLPVKTTIVFGKPIHFAPKTKTSTSTSSKTGSSSSSSSTSSVSFEPTPEELDEGHALFVKELTNLFDARKTELGYGNRTLEIL